MRNLLLILAALGLVGCGPSVQSWVRDDFTVVDQTKVKRLAVVVAPAPNQDDRLAALWALMARRYVNQHRNFLVKRNEGAASLDLPGACTGVEGALHLQPQQRPVGDEVEVAVEARLLRCRDGQAVWTGRVDGKWAANDPHLQELAEHYARELGPEVRPAVAPIFRALKALLDTLPQPVLSEEDEIEKIELGE